MRNRAGSNSPFLKRRFSARNAFTVVEILTFVAVGALLAAILWRLFSNAFVSVRTGTGHASITRYFRLAMVYLKDDLDNAVSVEVLGNRGEKLEINRISAIDAAGRATMSDVYYWNESGRIKRKEGGSSLLIGDDKQIEIDFSVKKEFFDGPDNSKYEVSVTLCGKNIGDASEADSIEIVVTPQMMIRNKSTVWTANPSETPH